METRVQLCCIDKGITPPTKAKFIKNDRLRKLFGAIFKEKVYQAAVDGNNCNNGK